MKPDASNSVEGTKAPVAKKLPILGGASGTIIFREGWDAPLTDEELEEWCADLDLSVACPR